MAVSFILLSIGPSHQDLFYEGKFEAGSSAATLSLYTTQLVSVARVYRPGNVAAVLSSVGGFAAILLPAMRIVMILTEGLMHYRARRRHEQQCEFVIDEETPRRSVPPASPARNAPLESTMELDDTFKLPMDAQP